MRLIIEELLFFRGPPSRLHISRQKIGLDCIAASAVDFYGWHPDRSFFLILGLYELEILGRLNQLILPLGHPNARGPQVVGITKLPGGHLMDKHFHFLLNHVSLHFKHDLPRHFLVIYTGRWLLDEIRTINKEILLESRVPTWDNPPNDRDGHSLSLDATISILGDKKPYLELVESDVPKEKDNI